MASGPAGAGRGSRSDIDPLRRRRDARRLGVTVAFLDVTADQGLQDEVVQRPTSELETAYEELQSTNEELETTNEELQSTIEELETTNEELQSTNEELETMNEELQSTNEELQTINEELRERSVELDEPDGSGILWSTPFGSAGRGGPRHAGRRVEPRLRGFVGPAVRRGRGLASDLDIGLPMAEIKPLIGKPSSNWTPSEKPSSTRSPGAAERPRCG